MLKNARAKRVIVTNGKAVVKVEDTPLTKGQLKHICQRRKDRLKTIDEQIQKLSDEKDDLLVLISHDEGCMAAIEEGVSFDPLHVEEESPLSEEEGEEDLDPESEEE